MDIAFPVYFRIVAGALITMEFSVYLPGLGKFMQTDTHLPDNMEGGLGTFVGYSQIGKSYVPMKYSIISLLIFFALAACNEEEPEPCYALPEPFAFKLVSNTGSNNLIGVSAPEEIGVFYNREGTEVFFDLEIKGSGEQTYAVSGALPAESAYRYESDIFYLKRGNLIDTLVVRVTERVPGESCEGFSYDAVTFNGQEAELDTTGEPAVYILRE